MRRWLYLITVHTLDALKRLLDTVAAKGHDEQ